MLTFEPINANNILKTAEFFKYRISRTSDYTIGALYMWRDFYQSHFAIYDDMLMFKVKFIHHTAFTLPIGGGSLKKAMEASGIRPNEERLRSVAANFLITSDVINTRIGALSEGQKGMVAFANLVLMEPGLLILDEPTNHINFRHLPIIAKALSAYTGAMILVSHVPEFVHQIRIDETLDLDK